MLTDDQTQTHFMLVPSLEGCEDAVPEAIGRSDLFSAVRRLCADLDQTQEEMIKGWLRMLSLRDHETEEHTQRVTELAVRMARAMDFTDDDLLYFRRGSLLHDIGKLGIPDSILHKPGPLTEGEWEIMRLHPVYAFQILSPIPCLQPALEIPFYHHEKWDGSGYPKGLKGEQIPLAARIFAVADVWDAITSARPYRPAWSEEAALKYVIDQGGKHFDPRMIEVFRCYYRESVLHGSLPVVPIDKDQILSLSSPT